MALSRKLAALFRTGALFAALWWIVFTLVSVIAGGPLIESALTYGVMFGLLGGISGVTTALLVAKGASSDRPKEIKPWRFTAFGFLGGALPIFGITALGVFAGTTGAVVPVMIGLAVGGGIIGGAVAGGAAAAVRKLPDGDAPDPQLPAS